MSYCPVALLEDIRGNGNDSNIESNSGGSSNSSSNNSNEMIQVQFPTLPSHPPTDSETATTTTSSTSAAADDQEAEATTSSSSSSSDQQGGMMMPRGANDGSDDNNNDGGGNHQDTPLSLSQDVTSLKSPPESICQQSSQPHQQHCDEDNNNNSCNSSSDDEMEIDDLDFTSSSHGMSATHQIKSALNKLVIAMKQRKKRHEEQHQQQQRHHHRKHHQQQQSMMLSHMNITATNGNINGGMNSGGMITEVSSTSQPSSSKEGGDNNSSNNNKSDRRPSLKQRPIQTIMTWMDSFQDHEDIQLICLQALPTILEDPSNRLAAQADGLASIVLYNMAAFPQNSLLQLTAFHTLVVLLRPLGTNEGMVHKANKREVHSSSTSMMGKLDTNKSGKGIRSIKKHHHHSHSRRHHHGHRKSSINATRPTSPSSTSSQQQQQSSKKKKSTSTIINNPVIDATYEPRWEENGVRVMLDSLRRFSSDRYLQAMGCWAMVNAALYPSLKSSLLRLGGVYTVTNAMMLHPNVEAVQFRGLFALINLVIPDKDNKTKDGDGSSIHSHIYQIARLTILAMKNFHTNKSILNRGCLVLRNLSLTPTFVKILARTPGCVDMLLHCRQMCPRDVLVQRSARTIMILVQRVTERRDDSKKTMVDGGDSNSFKLTQPRPLGMSMAAASASSSFLPK